MRFLRGVRGQGTVEFMVIFGAALLFFVIFMGIVQMNVSELHTEDKILTLQNVALNVRDEIRLAAQSSDGYIREFDVPIDILGQDYVITITESRVLVIMDDQTFFYQVNNITGFVQKGVNIIRKENGIIYLN